MLAHMLKVTMGSSHGFADTHRKCESSRAPINLSRRYDVLSRRYDVLLNPFPSGIIFYSLSRLRLVLRFA
jgi:hypothetical protein